ncbi:MAG TPA: CapA family protein [Candidatus Saccharimonadales bacterium]|nr:CapA family protein [Candidatus Saccharimonadales bacterium]
MKKTIFILGAILVLGTLLGIRYYLSSKKPASITTETTTPTVTETNSAPAKKDPVTTTIIFGGDVMLGRNVEQGMLMNGSLWPFAQVASTMKAADFTIVNLESMFSSTHPTTQTGSLILRGYPDGVKGMVSAGIDGVSLANNHVADMGVSGLTETMQILDANNIKHAGAGLSSSDAAAPFILDKGGVKFGFLSFTYGSNLDKAGVYYQKTTDDFATEIKDLKTKADVVIVLAHFGAEYQTKPIASQKTFARAAIDAGATLVIGAHPHIPEPVEKYGNGLIAYSLGNLVFDQTPEDNKDKSALLKVTFVDNKPTTAELLPYQIYSLGQPKLYTSATDKSAIYPLFGLTQATLALP